MAYDDVEEDLLAEQEREFEQEQQKERLARLQSEQQSPAEKAVNLAKDAAKTYAKKAVKNYAKGVIASTAPYWAPVLIAFLLLGGLIFFLSTTLVSVCNQGGLKGAIANGISIVASTIPGVPTDFCGALQISDAGQYQSGGGGGGGSFTTNMAFVLTSAYRPGPPSADSRGETVDIALRNPTDPIGSKDPRIAQLIALIQSVGFKAPQGYIQNEYINPSPGATGGHIHVQFNTYKSNGVTYTYCDNTVVKYPPDLVPIPSTIPMEGVSNPYLRQCMLDKIIAIFNAGSSIPTNSGTTTTP